MTFEESRLLIPQYLLDELPPGEEQAFEALLEASATLRTEVEDMRTMWERLALLPEEVPSAALRAQFYQKLNAMERNRETGRSRWFAGLWPQAAAAVLLFALGLAAGRANWNDRTHTEELAKMSSQVQNLRELVALSLLERQSASSRLEGVAYSSNIEQPNEEVVGALLRAVNHDANVNVRLSSINALERFAKDTAVSKALVDAIEHQDSPLVQIALIDSLVSVHNRSAAGELKRLTVAADVNPAVKQRAQWGLQKLSFE